jgi:hypothetical protein
VIRARRDEPLRAESIEQLLVPASGLT